MSPMGKKLFFAIGLFVTSQMLFASMGRAAVKSIRYATKADLVTVGLRESKTLKVKVRKTASQKNTKLIWKSTKPKVLYVNKRSGKMRGKKVGYATLIVKKVGSKARAKLRIHVVKGKVCAICQQLRWVVGEDKYLVPNQSCRIT